MLLDAKQLGVELTSALSDTRRSLLICSAYLKSYALRRFVSAIQEPESVNVTVVSRWRLEDLLTGASDLDAYEICKDHGWRFCIDPDMHIKLYVIDGQRAFVGSSNMTSSGMGISKAFNKEFSVEFPIAEFDMDRLASYVDGCVTVDASLYKKMRNEVEDKIDDHKMVTTAWSEEVEKMLRPSQAFFWVEDMLFSSPFHLHNETDEILEHDSEILGMDLVSEVDLVALKNSFEQSFPFRWLCRQLDQEDKKTSRGLNFGKLSSLMHNHMLDDPKPYRREVKDLVSNIFDWVEFLGPAGVRIEQHNVTRSIHVA
jgi:hypothetical protein